MEPEVLASRIANLCSEGSQLVDESLRSLQSLQVAALDLRDMHAAAQRVRTDLEALVQANTELIPASTRFAIEQYIKSLETMLDHVGPFVRQMERIGVFTALPLDLP